MISRALARRLHRAGLAWEPRNGDQFFIPDRDLDEVVFSVSEMSVDVQEIDGRHLIAFNGTVEWALDAIMKREVVWLPSEEQLRNRLRGAFVSLARTESGYRCVIAHGDERLAFDAHEAADAYARALLHELEQDRQPVRSQGA